MRVLLYRTTNVVDVTLTDPLSDDAPVTGAQVTLTLVDQAGQQVGGAAWPLTLQETTPGSGTYRGRITHEVEVAVGRKYVARIEVAAPTGDRAYTELTLPVEVDRT